MPDCLLCGVDHEAPLSQADFENFASGDNKAFRKIFDAYHQLIYRYVFSFCQNSDEAEDLVQEAFVTLFVNRLQLRNAQGVYPYLLVSAKRLAISSFRKRVVQTKYNDHLKRNWSERGASAEDELNASELSGLFDEAIGQLPPKQKRVYYLNKFEELSYQDIADEMGISKNTVKNHLIAASSAIKRKIAKVYLFLIALFFLLPH